MTSEQASLVDVGMDVVDLDGEKIGTVEHLVKGYMVVARGWLFASDYLVPVSEIVAVDGEVHLGVTKEEALERGFEPVAGRGSAQRALENDDPVDAIGMPEA